MNEATRLLALPRTLLLSLFLTLSAKAQVTNLPLNQIQSLNSGDLPNVPRWTFDKVTTSVTLSVALCATPGSTIPKFYVSNNTASNIPISMMGENVYELTIGEAGFGNVTMDSALDGGVFAVVAEGSAIQFEVALSDSGPLHGYSLELPLLGDTTSNQALLFSAPFDSLGTKFPEPSYPNYTLPSANLSLPSLPSTSPNFSLILAPTSSFPVFNLTSETNVGGLPVTACALQNGSNINGLIDESQMNSSLVVRDAGGWRTQWLVQGLSPQTNYTAFVVQDNAKVSGPINLVTKSASFSCPLVHSLPYCPRVSYAVPLPLLPFSVPSYDSTNVPDSVSGHLISYLANFTTSLLTFACGRDWYSPLQTCLDCQEAYRTWLCSVSFPRCGETPSTATTAISASGTTISPALVVQEAGVTQRNPKLSPPTNAVEILLPCLETCNAVDRTCPNFLGFACPVPHFNANVSYGVGFIDGDAQSTGTWSQGGGLTGVAQDRWGNVWCAGGV